MKRIFALVLLVASASPSWAARFTNQFTEFELPPLWQCSLEGAEWVCQGSQEPKKREAIIVLAAKLKGDQDSLDQYLAYLKGAKTFMSIQGKPIKSNPKYAKTVSINGHPWVDALHLDSEIPGFYTRYLATVKQDIAVLITYSINKTKYQDYLQSFDGLVKTLKVFRKAGGINAAGAGSNLFQNAAIPGGMSESTVFPTAQTAPTAQKKARASQKEDDFMLYLVLGIAAVGFLYWRRKQRGG